MKFLTTEIPLPESLPEVDTRPDDRNQLDELHSFASQVEIIIHTVNDEEASAVLGVMEKPTSSFSKPVNFDVVPFKFVLGMFGGYKAAQVKTRMGDDCEEVLNEALDKFSNVHAVLAVGIAYAMHREKCRYRICSNIGATLI